MLVIMIIMYVGLGLVFGITANKAFKMNLKNKACGEQLSAIDPQQKLELQIEISKALIVIIAMSIVIDIIVKMIG